MKTCKDCCGELVYDEFEFANYCFDCDEYVEVNNTKSKTDDEPTCRTVDEILDEIKTNGKK